IRSPNFFLTVAGEDRRKNTESALRAHLRLVRETGLDSTIVLVGTYSADEQPRRRWLEELYRHEGGNPHQAVFLEGISDADLANLNRHALAAVCPSLNEGFSVPVIEGMACGVPVLASDIPAHRELVEDADARFPPTDVEHLKNLLRKLAENPDLRQQLAQRQRPVVDRFTADKVQRRFWQRVFQEFHSRF